MKLIDCEVEPEKERFKLIYENGQICFHYYEGSKYWWLNGKRHRQDGPAVERASGTKEWHLNGKILTHSQWQKEVAKLNQSSCNGKVVEIEGDKYRLVECV